MSGTQASGPAASLFGGCPGNSDRLQPGKTGCRIETRPAGKSAVHHTSYAFDGDACLGDGSGQDDPPVQSLRGSQNAVLLGMAEVAVEGEDVGRHKPACQQFSGRLDLTCSGQEG